MDTDAENSQRASVILARSQHHLWCTAPSHTAASPTRDQCHDRSAKPSSHSDSLVATFAAGEAMKLYIAAISRLSPATRGANGFVPRAGPEDLSLLLYTSGTTGRPKGVPRRHRAERAAALAHVAQNLYARGERTLGAMPSTTRWACARCWRWRL